MQQQIVHLFVFDTLADWEIGYAIAGISDPAFQVQPGRYRVRTVGPTSEPVTTIGGVRILPDMTLDELNPSNSAMLILPGGVPPGTKAGTPRPPSVHAHSWKRAYRSQRSAAQQQGQHQGSRALEF